VLPLPPPAVLPQPPAAALPQPPAAVLPPPPPVVLPLPPPAVLPRPPAGHQNDEWSTDLLGPRAGGPTSTVNGHLTHSPARSDRARCPAPGIASRRRLLTMTKPKSKRKREAVTPAKEKQPVVEEPATEKFSPQLKLDFSKTFSPKL
jgi:hypothetical protein